MTHPQPAPPLPSACPPSHDPDLRARASHPPAALSRSTLRALLRGDVLAVQESDFLPAAACEQIAAEHDRVVALAPQIAAAYGFAREMTYTGPSLHDFEERPDEYFALATLARQTRTTSGPVWQSAVEAVLARLRALHDGEVRHAVQRSHGAMLFSGLLRNINHAAHAHTDYVPETLRGDWDLTGEVIDQFGLDLYVTPCKGGDVTVYDRSGRPGDGWWRPSRSRYGVREALFEGVPRVTVAPARGSFAIINTRRYHKVDAITSGSRMTVSMFLGLTRDGSLLVWA